MKTTALAVLAVIGFNMTSAQARVAAPVRSSTEHSAHRSTTSDKGYILPADDPFGSWRDPAGRPISPGR